MFDATEDLETLLIERPSCISFGVKDTSKVAIRITDIGAVHANGADRPIATVLQVSDTEVDGDAYLYVPFQDQMKDGKPVFAYDLKAARQLDPKIVEPETPGYVDFKNELIVAYSRIEPFMTNKGILPKDRQPFRDYFNSKDTHGGEFFVIALG